MNHLKFGLKTTSGSEVNVKLSIFCQFTCSNLGFFKNIHLKLQLVVIFELNFQALAVEISLKHVRKTFLIFLECFIMHLTLSGCF